MAEYIKRADALAYLDEGSYWEMEDFEEACALIKRVPAADVEEVRHGEWIGHEGYEECNICHHKALFEHNYCPNCGAKMDGKGEGDG